MLRWKGSIHERNLACQLNNHSTGDNERYLSNQANETATNARCKAAATTS